MANPLIKKCKFCSIDFKYYTDNGRHKIFCSRKCYFSYTRENGVSMKTRERMSIAQLKNGNMPPSWLGIKRSDESRKNYRLAKLGENNPRWNGGISKQKGYSARLWVIRNAKKYKAGGSHTIFQWEELKIKFGNMCLCCKRIEPDIKLTEDHIIPISRGGDDSIKNIQPLCRSCNSRKHVKTIDYISIYETKNNIYG